MKKGGKSVRGSGRRLTSKNAKETKKTGAVSHGLTGLREDGRLTTDETDGTDKSRTVSRKGAKDAKFQTPKEKTHHPASLGSCAGRGPLRWRRGEHGGFSMETHASRPPACARGVNPDFDSCQTSWQGGPESGHWEACSCPARANLKIKIASTRPMCFYEFSRNTTV